MADRARPGNDDGRTAASIVSVLGSVCSGSWQASMYALGTPTNNPRPRRRRPASGAGGPTANRRLRTSPRAGPCRRPDSGGGELTPRLFAGGAAAAKAGGARVPRFEPDSPSSVYREKKLAGVRQPMALESSLCAPKVSCIMTDWPKDRGPEGDKTHTGQSRGFGGGTLPNLSAASRRHFCVGSIDARGSTRSMGDVSDLTEDDGTSLADDPRTTRRTTITAFLERARARRIVPRPF